MEGAQLSVTGSVNCCLERLSKELKINIFSRFIVHVHLQKC